MSENPAKVLITGAGGFIGAALLDAYRAQGTAVCGVDLRGATPDVFRGDICEPSTWEHRLDGVDVVIHTAALVSNARDDADMWRVNVLATQALVDAAIRHGVRRFVHISSIVVYGNDACGELDEEQPVHAAGGSYVRTKLASEFPVLSAQARRQIEVTILRPGDVYGPGCHVWVAVPLAMIRQHQFLLPARGEGFFRPIYIDDLVRGVMAAASSPQAVGEIFNLACQGHVTTRTFFAYHHRWLGLRRGPLLVPTPLAYALAWLMSSLMRACGARTEASVASVAQLSTRSWFSIDKARRVLGWQPEVSLDDGMRRCETWARNARLL